MLPQAAENHEITAPLPSLADIQALQSLMIPHAVPQPEPIHRFAPGVYLRELTVPAGMLIVGKIHKHDHFLLVMSGRAMVVSEQGRELVEAGHVSMSPAGVKRVVLAIEDTRFLTIHHNPGESEDLQAVEAEHITPDDDLMRGIA